jgi:hypothetical protein
LGGLDWGWVPLSHITDTVYQKSNRFS